MPDYERTKCFLNGIGLSIPAGPISGLLSYFAMQNCNGVMLDEGTTGLMGAQ
jgi:hypothetical protein